ncbi:hypothetical protein SAMN05421805_12780 [Saccharopolyspora antimicrobica]|uniref:Uncharacterized protein n=1 Tax=Saccharopolyspora antimicrobica TaxID=455193 RepID=A0A1I5KMF9_9PSEU|nr:hypothetical protein [Saccharopolyspora antimicrobica]RKT85617.1 hypothetical protein ATL45_3964 [Saccharopolyspora antimicrobica]SFO86132.1 hypothetical protein SAMN05421805_12780 [Saccharopolyspora antimicrobica]
MREASTAPCTVGRCSRTADLGQYCCGQCVNTLLRLLGEIDDYATALDPTPRRGGTVGRRSPGYGSKPPARLDVIAARDPRSVPHAVGPDDNDEDLRSIIGSVTALARWVAEECDDQRPLSPPTVASETAYLRSRILWATGQQWIDELAEDIRELHTQARRLSGDALPSPAAPCPDCEGPLWPVGDADTIAVRCGVCGTSYDGLALLDLGQQFACQLTGAA